MYTRVLLPFCVLLLTPPVFSSQMTTVPKSDSPGLGSISTNDCSVQETQQPSVLHSTRREVLTDLVVRDKHHRLVTNLRPEEIEVFEDGVQQKISAFRKVEGAEQPATGQPAAKPRAAAAGTSPASVPAGIESLQQPNFVAIVFADIAPLNLSFAREAVQDFLNSGSFPSTYFSIYRLNHTLKVLQYYTANKDLLARMVDSAVRGSRPGASPSNHSEVTSAAYSTLQAAADNLLNSPRLDAATAMAVRDALLNPIPIISKDPLFARDSASQDASVTLGSAILTQARIETGIRFATSLSDGMDTLDALREVVRSQEPLPGRKVVLYLSDGLTLPMARQDVVASLISYANRSGVSFYAVDTRGLSLEDPMMRSLSEMERTQAISSAQTADPRTGHKEDDNIDLTAVANKQLALRELTESTGGFTVTDTNEIAEPMKRVMEETRWHYEIAYTPTNANFDGHFRRIEVKVHRSKVEVRARKGYLALPKLNGQPLQPFEAQALTALESPCASSNSFPYQVAVLRFRPRHDAVENQIAFEVPLSSLQTRQSGQSGEGSIRASLLALVRNAGGEVVGKISREVVRDLAPHSALADKDSILYAEPIRLPGGHYEVDAAVRDEQSGRTAVKRLAFFVDSGKDFGVSSLELVRPGSPNTPSALGATDDETVPVDPSRMLPDLSGSVRAGKPVHLYFVVYPAKGQAGHKPTVVLQVLQNGREVLRKLLPLRAPVADGSVPVMLKLVPEAGHCDILVTAQQGALVSQSSLSVKVE